MPDERQESINQGIGSPAESEIGKRAEREAREKLIHTPRASQPDSALGGTSDSDSPADEAIAASLRRDDQEKR